MLNVVDGVTHECMAIRVNHKLKAATGRAQPLT
jgi:hypothetical protein